MQRGDYVHLGVVKVLPCVHIEYYYEKDGFTFMFGCYQLTLN